MDSEFGANLAIAMAQFISRRKYPMKKLLTLLFSAVLVFSMAMPVVAQDTGAPESPKKEKKEKKAKKARKAKKEKKEKAEEPPK